jgi:hypothetical protein
MKSTATFAALAAGAAMIFAVPQAANAIPQANGVKQAQQSNVEKAGYRHRHRGWRHRHYRRHHHYRYGPRYYRRPGFGIYLGF